MINVNQILSQWIFRLLHNYFQHQASLNTDKLFIQLNGIQPNQIEKILQTLQENQENLKNYYEPVIRTIKPLEKFADFQCQSYETSTWLRNNIKSKEALILVFNDKTAEAQSLESIFSIDEAKLLSKEGLNALFDLLVQKNHVVPEEIEHYEVFLKMYTTIVEPQIQYILKFTEAILNDPNPSMIDKIQRNLPQLGMFVDPSLVIQLSKTSHLKKNYYFSRMKNNGKQLDAEKTLEKLYTFIEFEEKNNYPSELWNKVAGNTFEKKVETFKSEAISFIHLESLDLLKYDYLLIVNALNFKPKQSLVDKVRDIVEPRKDNFNEEQEKICNDGLDALVNKENSEDLQLFIESFRDDIEKEDVNLVKKLQREVEKMEHPSEYEQFDYALLYEIFSLIDDSQTELLDNTDVKFKLVLENKKLNDALFNTYKFYLRNIHNVIPIIDFEGNPTKETTEKNNELSFSLSLLQNDDILGKRKFKVSFSNSLKFHIFMEEDVISYVNNINETDATLISIQEEFEFYNAPNLVNADEQFHTVYHQFLDYIKQLNEEMNKAKEEGIFSVNVHSLERSTAEMLSQCYKNVSYSLDVLSFINKIGTVNFYDGDENNEGLLREKIVTLFNPIRLVSYLKRWEFMNNQIQEWLEKGAEKTISVLNITDYVKHLYKEVSKLAPQYIVDHDNHQLLIEKFEYMGEGALLISDVKLNSSSYINDVTNELANVLKSYLEVYPYAKDDLDVAFLYVNDSNIIMKFLDIAFKKTKVEKLSLLVHSSNQASKIYSELNSWITRKEEYSKGDIYQKFPKVDISVVSGQDVNTIEQKVGRHFKDNDLVVLVDYFGQNEQIEYEFAVQKVEQTTNYFETIYEEPTSQQDAIKKYSLVSEKMPAMIRDFYQLQYSLFSNQTPQDKTIHLLTGLISIVNRQQKDLIKFMNEKFNWSVIFDQYLDKNLLRKASNEVEIIQYKSKVLGNDELNLLLSSSKYIRKLVNHTNDSVYYDRIYEKIKSIIRNDEIDRNLVVNAVQKLKEFSGALVLKALGPGKFMHEMLSTYLAMEKWTIDDKNKLEVWTTCDNVPWMNKNKRRPDLVKMSFFKDSNGILNVDFHLMELKFINASIFESERIDAISQVKAGLDVYKDLFSFKEDKTDADYWKSELISYVIKLQDFTRSHIKLLKEFQDCKATNIQTNFSGTIDTFVYTSELTNFDFEVEGDVFVEQITSELKNYIYPRRYILQALGVTDEKVLPTFDDIESLSGKKNVEEILIKQELTKQTEKVPYKIDPKTPNEKEEHENNPNNNKPKPSTSVLDTTYADSNGEKKYVAETKDKDIPKEPTEPTVLNPMSDREGPLDVPEKLALVGVELMEEDDSDEDEQMKQKYIRATKSYFNANKIPFTITDSHIGSSVIRIVGRIPMDVDINRVKRNVENLQLQLGIDNTPTIKLDKNGINIDIVREQPKPIYFEKFMEKVREQLNEEINEYNLIAPLGLDPLDDIIYLDFSDSLTPHLLVGGTSGSGKSVTLNSIILSLMCLYTPRDVKFIFIDPKKVEFLMYKGARHTEQIVTEIDDAVVILEQLVEEMERRYSIFAEEVENDIKGYNQNTNNHMHRLVVVFDEFADFMGRDKETSQKVSNFIQRLGQKGRASGIHLIICTQSPKADIVPTNIRNNLQARLALKVTDSTASNIILGEDGAELLAGKGDFFAKLQQVLIRGKSPFLTSAVQKALIKYFRK